MYQLVKYRNLIEKLEKPLLTPKDMGIEEDGLVFNPGVLQKSNSIFIFPRIVDSSNRYDRKNGYVSRIGLARMKENFEIKPLSSSFILPDKPYDKRGVEDPRVNLVDGEYLITYTALEEGAWRGKNKVGVIHLKHMEFTRREGYEKLGVLKLCSSNKDAVFGPRRALNPISGNEEYFLLHRASWTKECLKEIKGKIFYKYGDKFLEFAEEFEFYVQRNGKYAKENLLKIAPQKESIWISFSEEHPLKALKKEKNTFLQHLTLLEPLQNCVKVGAGPPPIETDEGFLLIFHEVEKTGNERMYTAKFALLDKENPTKVIARSKKFAVRPEYEFERKGEVNNVIFPTGVAREFGDRGDIVFYGAADRYVGAFFTDFEKLAEKLSRGKLE